MIVVDTSSFVAFLQGGQGKDVDELGMALELKQVVFPAVVLTEILSDPKLDRHLINLLLQIPLLSTSEGYWERAGKARAKILSKGNKARVADALIAQACIDNHTPLLTRDKDFNHFRTACGLKLHL